MINSVHIKNFKSIQDLELDFGRFNILIGSNGSGKSNILEAIAFGGAASADKLDNEFLGSRGIRTSDVQLMKSAFTVESPIEPIELLFRTTYEDSTIGFFTYTIEEEKETPIIKWSVREKKNEKIINTLFSSLVSNDTQTIKNSDFLTEEEKEKLVNLSKQLQDVAKDPSNLNTNGDDTISKFKFILDSLPDKLWSPITSNKELSNFLIYSPEIGSLRKFEEESQIQPLGIKGEGLFNILQIFNERYTSETIDELKKYLHIIEWFNDFEAVFDKTIGRKILVVKDQFLPSARLNQNNVNEGFLYLLFYISLFISKETPSFFAIDNIEASFHPRLCEELTNQLIKLSKKYNKQIILTTHNPFILDGLDLRDRDQSLFVVRRNAEGATIADKITKKPSDLKLSEAWTLGYIGGQPETIE